jgi:hypothetical protein
LVSKGTGTAESRVAGGDIKSSVVGLPSDSLWVRG